MPQSVHHTAGRHPQEGAVCIPPLAGAPSPTLPVSAHLLTPERIYRRALQRRAKPNWGCTRRCVLLRAPPRPGRWADDMPLQEQPGQAARLSAPLGVRRGQPPWPGRWQRPRGGRCAAAAPTSAEQRRVGPRAASSIELSGCAGAWGRRKYAPPSASGPASASENPDARPGRGTQLARSQQYKLPRGLRGPAKRASSAHR